MGCGDYCDCSVAMFFCLLCESGFCALLVNLHYVACMALVCRMCRSVAVVIVYCYLFYVLAWQKSIEECCFVIGVFAGRNMVYTKNKREGF